MKKDVLSDGDASACIEIIHSSVNSGSAPGTLENIWNLAHEYIGIDGIVFGKSISSDEQDIPKHLTYSWGYPEEWLDTYHANHYSLIDPIVQVSLTVEGPITWEYAIANTEIDLKVQKFLESASKWNLFHGMSCASKSHPSSHAASIVSVTTYEKPLTSRQIAMLDRVLPSLNMVMYSSSFYAGVELTPGQREVLICAAGGLSAKESADHIKISPRTVEQRLTDACRVLKAANKTQAVAKFIRSGQMD